MSAILKPEDFFVIEQAVKASTAPAEIQRRIYLCLPLHPGVKEFNFET